MVRGIAGIASGLVVWTLVATLGNLALRFAWPAYANVERAMTFTLAMLAARLVLGVVSSFCAGVTVAWIARRDNRIVAIFTGILFAVFVPVHYNLWDRFPLWYHVVFLASLVVMSLLGAALYRRAA